MRQGLLADFDAAASCAAAIRDLRGRGFTKLDAYMPYPEKSVQQALEVKRSPLPWLCFGAGLVGAALAYLILWYTTDYDYRLNVGGRPTHPVPAFVPITFETLILFAGTMAFVGGLLLARLPKLYHPVFEVDGIERVTVDRFMVAIDASDPQFDPERTHTLLLNLGASNTSRFGYERQEWRSQVQREPKEERLS